MNKFFEKAGQTAFGFAAVGMVVASLAGCATPPADPAARAEFEQINDPLEPMNRYFFELNRFLDFLFVHPWADTYRRIVPEFGRERVHNVLDNVGSPLDAVNEAFQGRATDSVTTLGRMVVNTTAGVGGLFDVATDLGLENKGGDFGQTLHVWGAPEGPYLVLPLFGPSNPRDAVGLGVDSVADPVGWLFKMKHLSNVNTGLTVATVFDKRAQYIEPMEALEKSSIDFYAQVRSMSRQHRAKELGLQTQGGSTYPNYEFYDEPTGKTAAPAKGK